jgi:acetyl-CoA carboxylase biotin carboxylase subunit
MGIPQKVKKEKKMNKILIANRGEIAVRIIRACKEMNIKTVAVYSEADKDSMHTRLADEAICIGPANSSKSYLNYKNIIEAAYITGSDSIHPGFGFLSENSQFAKICEESNIKFIGPSYDVIKLMGNKSNAKEMMEKAGVPVVPGSKGSVRSINEAKKIAKEIGYPVMIKAAAGGGGKGIRIVNNEDEMENCYNIVKQEALISFKDDEIYIEKFIQNPRHVEIQILADEHGNVIHLGERDCTVQRKNQKIIEETPSTAIDDKLREKMGDAAIKAAKKVGYTSCGTIEFLVDKNKNFYFMEMNTRIQVEHGITEERTGIDIVKEQIRIAAGEKLKIKQKDVEFRGHSIECRINAENPEKKFRPCPGKITGLILPGGNGIRVDTFVYEGYTIPANYDSMIAKIIATGKTRNEAISKMKRALEETVIEGVDTNIDFLFKIIRNSNFLRGKYDTSFIEKEIL